MAVSFNARPSDSKKFVSGVSGEWEVVIGLEVHAQIKSDSKLFSGAAADFGSSPNLNVALLDAGMPGMLPVMNEYCVKQAIKTGLGLNAEINLASSFDRKNYFYPDLPQGYQISQFYRPIVGEGALTISVGPDENGGFDDAVIGIERLHLEQDAGKSLHDQHPTMSYVDLNRCGVALMEIVSKPDLRSAEEAKAYLVKLRSIMRYLGTCDGNMDEGSMRADVNVSVRRPGESLGERCEVKNVNSIKFVGQAINYEARRQIDILEAGGKIIQETRLFDSARGETRSMRTKEDAHDYRYFPEPDLPVLLLTNEDIENIRTELPAMPDAIKKDLVQSLGLSAYDASILTSEQTIVAYFYDMVGSCDAKLAANWIINDLLGALNKANLSIEQSPVAPKQLAQLVELIQGGEISGKIAKTIFDILWRDGGSPFLIIEKHGLSQITDSSSIEKIIIDIIATNPDKVEQLKAKPALIGWFVGQVMKVSEGKASPQIVNKLLKQKLSV